METLQERRYIDSLIIDFDRSYSQLNRPLQSIFCGGGTPSLFSANAYARLLTHIACTAEVSAATEVTMEANPGTLEHADFSGYRQAGINRLSLGIQSFNDRHLQSLARIHDATQADKAIRAAQKAGFDNLNLDIMFGLPAQTLKEAIEDCKTAISFGASHLSFYQLTLEPNTLFYAKPPALPDSDSVFAMQQSIIEMLDNAGYDQYEVSAFSLPGRQCRHNLNYWTFGDYLGIGAGAHTKLTTNGTTARSWKEKHPATFMHKIENAESVAVTQIVDPQSLIFEFLLNALRLKDGFRLQQFESTTGQPAEQLIATLKDIDALPWFHIENTHLRLTDHGYRFIDELLQKLV